MNLFTKTIMIIGMFVCVLVISTNSSADCGTITCYDYCDSGYVTVRGNSCTTSWNFERGCYAAAGDCSDSSNDCSGQQINCWDYCANSFVSVRNANSCSLGWNFAKSCYSAVGSCN